MVFDALADWVVVVHLAFVVFIAVGALLAWRWRWLVWAPPPSCCRPGVSAPSSSARMPAHGAREVAPAPRRRRGLRGRVHRPLRGGRDLPTGAHAAGASPRRGDHRHRLRAVVSSRSTGPPAAGDLREPAAVRTACRIRDWVDLVADQTVQSTLRHQVHWATEHLGQLVLEPVDREAQVFALTPEGSGDRVARAAGVDSGIDPYTDSSAAPSAGRSREPSTSSRRAAGRRSDPRSRL